MTSPRSTLLATADLDRGARELSQLARGVTRIAAVGGYAMQVYGSDRLTGDLDIISNDRIRALPKKKMLSFGGYSSTTPSGIPVDVILRSDAFEGLYDNALVTARKIAGIPILVVRPGHLAGMKMIAGRAKDDLDLLFLLARMNAAERRATRKLILRYLGEYAARDLDGRMAEADWSREQGRI
jgi:hypothetical protein